MGRSYSMIRFLGLLADLLNTLQHRILVSLKHKPSIALAHQNVYLQDTRKYFLRSAIDQAFGHSGLNTLAYFFSWNTPSYPSTIDYFDDYIFLDATASHFLY